LEDFPTALRGQRAQLKLPAQERPSRADPLVPDGPESLELAGALGVLVIGIPGFWVGHLSLAQVYVQKGMYDEALAELRRAKGATVEARALMAYTYAVSGQRRQATRVLAELLELTKQQYVPPFHIATIYAGLGDKDRALAWLEKAYEQHDFWLRLLKVEPSLDSLRPDPRFQDLLNRMGLSP
jgi:tetratricopeptide (TPR) repeat protein